MNFNFVKDRAAPLLAFADRVEVLTPDEWDSVHRRCAPLAGSSAAAILARTQLSAAPFSLGVITGSAQEMPFPYAAVAGVIRVALSSFVTTTQLALQLAFSAFPKLDEPPTPLGESTGNPLADAYIDARHRVAIAIPSRFSDPLGLKCALDAALRAVSHRALLTPSEYAAIFLSLEPEIDRDSLEVTERTPPRPGQ